MPAVWFATPIVMLVLAAATVTDLRGRQVPAWLTFGGTGVGLAVAAAAGWEAFQLSVLGLLVGGTLLLPFVLKGGFGEADALLLAFIGTWQGWQFALWAAWWAALLGAGLAAVAWWRGLRAFPYVPAIAVGAALALVVA